VPGSRGRRGRRIGRGSPGRTSEPATERDPEAPRSRLRRVASSPLAVLVAAVSALVTALVVGVGQELFPKENLADRLRPGDAIGVTVSTEEPQAAVPGAVARERLDSPDSQKAIEAIRPPFSDAVANVPLVPASQTRIFLQLTGQRSQPVNVIGMRIRVLRREPPLTGTFLLGPGPQGDTADLVLQATVDDPAPKLSEPAGGSIQQPYFSTHHASLSRGQTVPIVMFMKAAHCYCEWDVAIEYVSDGKTGVTHVGKSGIMRGARGDRPFAITALPPRIQDYGVVYTFPAQGAGDSYYRRVPADQYCSAVSAFYANSYRELALERWAC
jgi:hypothetical protein